MTVAPETRIDTGDDDAAMSPFGILNGLLRHRYLLMVAVVVGLGGGLVAAVLQVPRYEAVVRFVSSPGNTRSVPPGVGTDMSLAQQRDPFDYYSSVLTSSEVLDSVLKTTGPDGVSIRDRIGVPAAETDPFIARGRLRGAQPRLDSLTRTRSAASVPVLLIKATWTDPSLAADLANAFVDALAEYDRTIRSSAARQRREFIEAQIKETQTSLQKAENDHRTFKEQNRLLIMGDTPLPLGQSRPPVPPLLQLRDRQLQREVTVQGELYLSLKKAFDQARISELDEASGLVVIERAGPRPARIGTARSTLVLVGGVVGLAVGFGLVVMLELRRRADLSSPEAQEFVGLVADVRQDFSRLRGRASRLLAPDDGPPAPSTPPRQ